MHLSGKWQIVLGDTNGKIYLDFVAIFMQLQTRVAELQLAKLERDPPEICCFAKHANFIARPYSSAASHTISAPTQVHGYRLLLSLHSLPMFADIFGSNGRTFWLKPSANCDSCETRKRNSERRERPLRSQPPCFSVTLSLSLIFQILLPLTHS